MMKNMDIMNNDVYEKMIEENKEYIIKYMKQNNIIKKYNIAIVLGSGLKEALDEMTIDFEIPYIKFPYMPSSNVKGHESKYIFGTLKNKNIVVMSGRVHIYEGYSPREVTMGIRTLKSIGIEKLILTNAAGGINENFNVGDIMLIKDHINMTSINPLVGKNLDAFGERFPSLSDAWKKEFREKIKEEMILKNINIKEGIYAYNLGPSYETLAEVVMLRTLGVDAVGMSTVPECIVAVHGNMDLIGLSAITNKCGIEESQNHSEVIANAEKSNLVMKEILKSIIENIW